MIDAAGPQDEEERTQGVLTKAQILRDADRVGQAVAVLEAADRDLPDTVEIKYELAMLYERQDRVADLERLLRQVIALDPDHAHAYNALGYTLADRNQRLPEALDLITQALELAPNDPFILDSMGWVKFRMGDQAAAAEYLRRAYSTRPEADIAAHLAEVLWSQGKRDQAVELLRGAKLRTRPTAPCSTRSSGWGRALTTAVMLRWRDASAWLRGALMAMLAFTLAACTTTPKPIEGHRARRVFAHRALRHHGQRGKRQAECRAGRFLLVRRRSPLRAGPDQSAGLHRGPRRRPARQRQPDQGRWHPSGGGQPRRAGRGRAGQQHAGVGPARLAARQAARRTRAGRVVAR